MKKIETGTSEFIKVDTYFNKKISKYINNSFFVENSLYEYKIFNSILDFGGENPILLQVFESTTDVYLAGYSNFYEYEYIENKPYYRLDKNFNINISGTIALTIHPKSQYTKNGILYSDFHIKEQTNLDLYLDFIFIFSFDWEFCIIDYARGYHTVIYYNKSNARSRLVLEKIAQSSNLVETKNQLGMEYFLSNYG